MKTFVSGAVFLFVIGFHAQAQMEKAAFSETGRGAVNAFATDYQALGVNPANLAWGNEYNRRFTMGFLQVGISAYSEALTRENLSSIIFDREETLTPAEKLAAGEAFTRADHTLNGDLLLFGAAVQSRTVGNFAFSINFSNHFYTNLSGPAARQLFTGFLDPYFDQWLVRNATGGVDTIPNQGPGYDRLDDVIRGFSTNPLPASELYRGSKARALSTVEYSFGYGYTAHESKNLKFSVGAGLKYVQGLYILDLNIDDDGIASAYTASTPAMDIDYGEAAMENPSAISGASLKSVGSGFGFDLGLNLELSEMFRFGLSIVDIGFLTFDGNVYTARDTAVIDVATLGLNTYNIVDDMDAFVGKDGLFEWDGEEERNVSLPTRMRFGMGYFPLEWLRLGLDLAVPLNDKPGNPEQMFFAAGMDFVPTSSVRISAGAATGADYGLRVPFGLNFVLGEGGWEMGVATRDILYALREDQPHLSGTFGFLRYRMGQLPGVPQSSIFY